MADDDADESAGVDGGLFVSRAMDDEADVSLCCGNVELHRGGSVELQRCGGDPVESAVCGASCCPIRASA